MDAPNKAKSQEEEAARFLALRWELEYREAHTLSLDPNALGIIDPAEARRLEALPLQIGVDGPVFVVAEPSAERFAAVRALVGENASFVVVAQPTLEALMNSKVFNPGTKKPRLLERRHRPEPEPVQAERPPERAPEPSRPEPAPPPLPDRQQAPQERSAPEPPPAEVFPQQHDSPQPTPPQPVVPEPVAAAPLPPMPPVERTPEAPRPSRIEEPAPAPPSFPRVPDTAVETQPARARDDAPPRPTLVPVETTGDEPTELLDNLLTQIAASTGNLTAHVKELNEALQATQRELREAKEQLAEAQIESERHRGMIETLRDDLAKSRALTDATTSRLRDVVRALEAPTLGEALSSGPDAQQSGPIEARGRIA